MGKPEETESVTLQIVKGVLWAVLILLSAIRDVPLFPQPEVDRLLK